MDKKRKPGLRAKATITKVQLVKAAEFFKDKAKDPEQQLYAVHGRVNDREMRIGTFTKPQSDEISPKRSWRRFKQRYKRFPTLGMKVDVVTDENGYWKIAVCLHATPFLQTFVTRSHKINVCGCFRFRRPEKYRNCHE